MKTAAEIMTKNVVTVKQDTSLQDALKMMDEQKISHLVVVDDDRKVIGIFSDRDVKKLVSPFAGSSRETDQDRATLKIKAAQLMKSPIIAVKPDDSIKTCAEKMLQKSIHAVPVIEENAEVKGIVSSSDLLKVLIGML